MKTPAFSILFIAITLTGFAQSKPKNGNAQITAAKPLSAADSGLVRQLFYSALREKTIENYKLASDYFSRVLQIDPANDASMFELANIQKQQNNYQAAQPLLERAVTINPDNEWYWRALANSYEKTNDVARLQNVFTELIRLSPDKADYYFDKANAFFLQKKYDEALQVLDQAEQITGPSDDLLTNRQKIYLKQGDVTKAAANIEKMIAANPNQSRYYIMLAEIYNSNGLNEKALAALQRAEKADSQNGMIHLGLADIYRDKKDYEASFKELSIAFAIPDLDADQKIRIILGYLPQFPDPDAKKSALALSKILVDTHPENARANAIYADMLAQNGNYREARISYKKAILQNSQVYTVQEQLVRIELGENDADAAIADGETALSYFPNQAVMNYLVGVAWQQKKNYNKAIGYLKNVTALETQDKVMLSLCYSSLGDCYHSISDHKNSDAAYDKALTYDPDNAFTLNNHAYYLSLRNEQLDKAARMSKHSNELQVNTAAFEDTYAWVLFRQKDYAGAKVWIEKSLQHDKANSAVKTEHYGDILYLTGNTDAAVQNWLKARAQGGASPVLDRKINEKKYLE